MQRRARLSGAVADEAAPSGAFAAFSGLAGEVRRLGGRVEGQDPSSALRAAQQADAGWLRRQGGGRLLSRRPHYRAGRRHRGHAVSAAVRVLQVGAGGHRHGRRLRARRHHGARPVHSHAPQRARARVSRRLPRPPRPLGRLGAGGLEPRRRRRPHRRGARASLPEPDRAPDADDTRAPRRPRAQGGLDPACRPAGHRGGLFLRHHAAPGRRHGHQSRGHADRVFRRHAGQAYPARRGTGQHPAGQAHAAAHPVHLPLPDGRPHLPAAVHIAAALGHP